MNDIERISIPSEGAKASRRLAFRTGCGLHVVKGKH